MRLLRTRCYAALHDGVHGLRFRQPDEVGRRERGHVIRRPRSDPDPFVHENLAVHEHAVDLRERKRRDCAGSEPGRSANLVRAGHLRLAAARGARDLARVGSPVAGDHDDQGFSVAVEDERLDDLCELAADGSRCGLGGGRSGPEFLDPRLGTTCTQEGGHALDPVRPPALHRREPSLLEPGPAPVRGVAPKALEQVTLFATRLRDPEERQDAGEDEPPRREHERETGEEEDAADVHRVPHHAVRALDDQLAVGPRGREHREGPTHRPACRPDHHGACQGDDPPQARHSGPEEPRPDDQREEDELDDNPAGAPTRAR